MLVKPTWKVVIFSPWKRRFLCKYRVFIYFTLFIRLFIVLNCYESSIGPLKFGGFIQANRTLLSNIQLLMPLSSTYNCWSNFIHFSSFFLGVYVANFSPTFIVNALLINIQLLEHFSPIFNFFLGYVPWTCPSNFQ